MQRRFLFFVLITQLITGKLAAQSNVRDSLVRQIGKSQDSAKINLLNALSKWYWRRNGDSGLLYADSAALLSENIHYLNGLAEANRNKGVILLIKSNPAIAAIPFLENALSIFKQAGNTRGIADTYNNLGSAWISTGNDSASLRCYDSSLILYRSLRAKDGEAAVLNYIGMVYKSLGNYIKSIDFTLAGLNLRLQTKDHEGIVFSYINTAQIFHAGNQSEKALEYAGKAFDYAIAHDLQPPGMIFDFYAQVYLDLKNYPAAKEYLQGKPKGRSAPYHDPLLIGRYYFETGNFDSAFRYFETALRNTSAIDKDRKVLTMISLAKTYEAKGDKARSSSIAREAYQLAGQLPNRQTLAESASILARILFKEHDYKRSLELFQLEHAIRDSFVNGSYQNKLSFFEYNASIVNKEDSIKLLSVQNNLQSRILSQEKKSKNIIIFFSAAALLTGLFVFRNINNKKKRIELQKDQIANQKAEVEHAMVELKSTQSQLIQKEKMASLGELTSGIAHEIQNPLNFVNNFSEVSGELLEEARGKRQEAKENSPEVGELLTEIKQNLEKINHHGNRADAIVKSMLQHSYSSGGQKEPADINALADEYLRLSYHGWKAKLNITGKEGIPAIGSGVDIKLTTDLDPQVGKVNIISQDIARVLVNLYNNAFFAVTARKKEFSGSGSRVFMPDNYEPEIIVSTRMEKNQVKIEVADNGNGIPEAISEKIFQPFFTTKPAGQGTGLGLSLSYEIIKSMGGKLSFESRNGEGAVFSILLPLT